MGTIAAFEAEADLHNLLERVRKGEQITITEEGVPVAMLVPAPVPVQPKRDVREVIAELKELRKGHTLPPGMTIRDLINEGRRY